MYTLLYCMVELISSLPFQLQNHRTTTAFHFGHGVPVPRPWYCSHPAPPRVPFSDLHWFEGVHLSGPLSPLPRGQQCVHVIAAPAVSAA